MKPQHPRALAAILCSILALMAICAPLRPVLAKDKLQVACSGTGLLFVVPYIAKKLGYFDQQGLDVDVYDANGGANGLAALVGGSAQIALTGYKYVSVTVLKGQKLKAIATSLRGFPQSLVVRPDLVAEAKLTPQSSLADKAAILRHRIIGVQDIGGSTGDFVRFVLKTGGIEPSDVTMINVPSADSRVGSLKAKRIDAFMDSSPGRDVAVTTGIGNELVFPNRDLQDATDFEYNVVAVRQDYLKANPEILERFLMALQQATDTVRTDPDKAKQAVFGFMADEANTDTVFSQEVRDRAWTNILPNIPNSLVLDPQKLIRARSFFGISDQVTDAELVDSTLAEKVSAASTPAGKRAP